MSCPRGCSYIIEAENTAFKLADCHFLIDDRWRESRNSDGSAVTARDVNHLQVKPKIWLPDRSKTEIKGYWAKLALSLLAAFLLTVEQQPSASAANSSVIIYDKVTCDDIKALRNHSSNFQVLFDPAHDTRNMSKQNHFELNAVLTNQQRQKLAQENPQTFSKFRFETQPVQNHQNRLKFEIRSYGKDFINQEVAGLINKQKNNPQSVTTTGVNLCQ